MSSEMREIKALADAVEFGIALGKLDAPAVFTKMRDLLNLALLARTEAGDEKVSGCEDCAHNGRYLCDTHVPQDASGDAAPVLFGRGSGGDWYVDADTKSICVDVDFDPARQLSLILKQDGRVAWSIFVQEPDSSTTKATGPSVMNTGFYEALSYIAMQAKEAK